MIRRSLNPPELLQFGRPRAQYRDYGAEWLVALLAGARVTALLTLFAFVLAMAIGGAVAALRLSRQPVLRGLARGYLEIVRGVPALAILFLIYFGLPGAGVTLYRSRLVWSAWESAAAPMCPRSRAGVGTLHRGQREAALAVGMTPFLAARFVVFPQVLRAYLSALLSTLIVLLKDSSLCALITVDEIMLTGRALSTEYFLPLAIFILAGAIYFSIAWPLSLVTRWLERGLSRGRHTLA